MDEREQGETFARWLRGEPAAAEPAAELDPAADFAEWFTPRRAPEPPAADPVQDDDGPRRS
jgi:hypothetical protein